MLSVSNLQRYGCPYAPLFPFNLHKGLGRFLTFLFMLGKLLSRKKDETKILYVTDVDIAFYGNSHVFIPFSSSAFHFPSRW